MISHTLGRTMEHFLQTRESAKGLLMQILQAFKQHNVNPTPINYAVWYEYLLARNPELQKSMNESLRAKDGFTDIVGYRLYQQYIKAMPEDMVYVNDQINEATKNLVESLQAVTAHIESHISLLEETSAQEALLQLKETIHLTKKNAIESIKKAGKLAQQTSHVCNHIIRDPVTKLFSRAKLEHDYKVFRDCGSQPGLILIDLDGFAEINKAHGMLVAENVLRHIANLIKEVVSIDFAYRIGGHDEFCIMTGAPMKDDSLSQIANQILARISEIRLVDKNTQAVIAEDMSATAILFEGTQNGLQASYENAKKEMRATKRNKRLLRQKKQTTTAAT